MNPRLLQLQQVLLAVQHQQPVLALQLQPPLQLQLKRLMVVKQQLLKDMTEEEIIKLTKMVILLKMKH